MVKIYFNNGEWSYIQQILFLRSLLKAEYVKMLEYQSMYFKVDLPLLKNFYSNGFHSIHFELSSIFRWDEWLIHKLKIKAMVQMIQLRVLVNPSILENSKLFVFFSGTTKPNALLTDYYGLVVHFGPQHTIIQASICLRNYPWGRSRCMIGQCRQRAARSLQLRLLQSILQRLGNSGSIWVQEEAQEAIFSWHWCEPHYNFGSRTSFPNLPSLRVLVLFAEYNNTIHFGLRTVWQWVAQLHPICYDWLLLPKTEAFD